MPAPLAPRKRAAVLKDIRAGLPRNEIARKHKVSQGTVTGIAKAEHLTDAFDRSATIKATAAAQADHQAMLADLAARHMKTANAILDSFEGDHDWSGVSPHTRAIALGICSDKARELAPDTDGQADAAKSLLSAVLDGMVARHGDAA